MHRLLPEDFKVTRPIKLAKTPTRHPLETTKEARIQGLSKLRADLAKLQDRLYAHGKYGVLVCFQGMDTAGKDSLIREVFKDFNARGIIVHSFKTPNTQELRHDYLWRHYLALPERGKFAVFNRSHYENLLVTRVYPEYILKENLPGIESVEDIKPKFWERRFEQINNFEQHVAENGTLVFKFFLHLGKEEQRQRLLRRLETEKHNWKFEPGDLRDRSNWDKFQGYYEEILNKTSTPDAPWYLIPADCKETARYLVAKIILEELARRKDIRHPELDAATKANIEHYRQELLKD